MRVPSLSSVHVLGDCALLTWAWIESVVPPSAPWCVVCACVLTTFLFVVGHVLLVGHVLVVLYLSGVCGGRYQYGIGTNKIS